MFQWLNPQLLIQGLEPAPYVTPRKMTLISLANITPKNGCFVEFGVCNGGTAYWLDKLAKEQNRNCHLFDTFEGIPEASEHDDAPGKPRIPIGHFKDITDLNAVKELIPHAIFHVGIFPDTMPNTFEPISFVHVDCDQYYSCLAAIKHFIPYMVKDGIMLFDDYNVTPGVEKAVNQTLGASIKLTNEGKAYYTKI